MFISNERSKDTKKNEQYQNLIGLGSAKRSDSYKGRYDPNETNYCGINKYLFHIGFDEESQGLRSACQRDVEGFELPAPFAARIEGERHLPGVSRCNGL